MQAIRIISLCLALTLGACTNRPPALSYGNLGPQTIAPGVTLTLPDDPPFEKSLFVTQLVQAHFLTQHHTIQSIIESDAVRFTIAMAIPSGPEIMRADWSHLALIEKTQALTPRGLSSEQMLADLMLVYAPFNLVRSNIHGAAFISGAKGERLLVKEGRILIRITRPEGNPWNGVARIENEAFQYGLVIHSRFMGGK